MNKKAAVIFGELPQKSAPQWNNFEVIVAPAALRSVIEGKGISFVALETLVSPGNIREATAFLRELSQLTHHGASITKSTIYSGYELWWTSYDEIFYRLCIPYTQYRSLLEYLVGFSHISLYTPPSAGLFTNYLEAHGSSCTVYGGARAFPPLGIWIQIILTLFFLPWLMIKRPKVMLWTSDLFDPPRDHDFRMRYVYEELRGRSISFVECIRSMESAKTVFSHAWRRRRPVLYSYALYVVFSWLTGALPASKRVSATTPEEEFKLRLATYYTPSLRARIWTIRALGVFLKLTGVQAGFILAGMSRTFNELLACKLSGIPTVGILHGVSSQYYNAYDFMPEFEGKKMLSVDEYGVWSPWWKNYYLQHSKAYKPEQLYVSGPMRPLQGGEATSSSAREKDSLNVLFVSEVAGVPIESVPYLEALLDAPDLSVYLKFRSYRDEMEQWLKANRPDLLEKVPPERILQGSMSEALAKCDVAVGSYSTAVLEALLQNKPPVFFKSQKWGDYFELESTEGKDLIAASPAEFLAKVRKSGDVSAEILSSLRQQYFGDPNKNGSAWVVDRLEAKLRKS